VALAGKVELGASLGESIPLAREMIFRHAQVDEASFAKEAK